VAGDKPPTKDITRTINLTRGVAYSKRSEGSCEIFKRKKNGMRMKGKPAGRRLKKFFFVCVASVGKEGAKNDR
jgi:hypothetical protein